MRLAYLLLFALAGCAVSKPPAPGPEPATAWERGRSFARRSCAGCHAIGAAQTSPNPAAPPFWRLAERYDPLTLRVALGAVSGFGHGEMPPIAIVGDEIDDVADYIASVSPPLAGERQTTASRTVTSPGF